MNREELISAVKRRGADDRGGELDNRTIEALADILIHQESEVTELSLIVEYPVKVKTYEVCVLTSQFFYILSFSVSFSKGLTFNESESRLLPRECVVAACRVENSVLFFGPGPSLLAATIPGGLTEDKKQLMQLMVDRINSLREECAERDPRAPVTALYSGYVARSTGIQGLIAKQAVVLVAYRDRIVFYQEGQLEVSVPLEKVSGLEIAGPGHVVQQSTSGGGYGVGMGVIF